MLDATFRRRSQRMKLRRQFGPKVCTVFVECIAPPEVLSRRAWEREHDPQTVSDATAAIAERIGDEWQPLSEIPGGRHLMLRTDRPTQSVVDDLLALLDQRL